LIVMHNYFHVTTLRNQNSADIHSATKAPANLLHG